MNVEVVLGAGLIASAILNFATFWFLRKRNKVLKSIIHNSESQPTYDCRELLHDLTEGHALVKITRISPLDVFIRRS